MKTIFKELKNKLKYFTDNFILSIVQIMYHRKLEI